MRQPARRVSVDRRPRRGHPPRARRRATPATSCVIAGKGHEDYQIVGSERRPFSDRRGRRSDALGESRHDAATSPSSRALTGGAARRAPIAAFGGVSTDTRTLEPGELFVALRGERFDGNDFVARPRQRGAAARVVEPRRSTRRCRRSSWPTRRPRSARSRAPGARDFARPVVGVTGSNGKTTVKEMTRRDPRRARALPRHAGNLNNHIGVPLTLLAPARPQHRFAVIEMGANHRGEIAAPGRDRRARRRPHHQRRRRRTSKASAASRASRAARARCSRRSAPTAPR